MGVGMGLMEQTNYDPRTGIRSTTTSPTTSYPQRGLARDRRHLSRHSDPMMESTGRGVLERSAWQDSTGNHRGGLPCNGRASTRTPVRVEDLLRSTIQI